MERFTREVLITKRSYYTHPYNRRIWRCGRIRADLPSRIKKFIKSNRRNVMTFSAVESVGAACTDLSIGFHWKIFGAEKRIEFETKTFQVLKTSKVVARFLNTPGMFYFLRAWTRAKFGRWEGEGEGGGAPLAAVSGHWPVSVRWPQERATSIGATDADQGQSDGRRSHVQVCECCVCVCKVRAQGRATIWFRLDEACRKFAAATKSAACARPWPEQIPVKIPWNTGTIRWKLNVSKGRKVRFSLLHRTMTSSALIRWLSRHVSHIFQSNSHVSTSTFMTFLAVYCDLNRFFIGRL